MVDDGIDQSDFSYFPGRILLNKPKSLSKPKIYIAINYHSLAFCHHAKKDPNDKQIKWIISFSKLCHLKLTSRGIDIKIPGKNKRLVSISIATVHGKDIINLINDYKELSRRLKVNRKFLSK